MFPYTVMSAYSLCTHTQTSEKQMRHQARWAVAALLEGPHKILLAHQIVRVSSCLAESLDGCTLDIANWTFSQLFMHAYVLLLHFLYVGWEK